MKVFLSVKRNLFAASLVGVIALLSGSSLSADTLRVNVDYWPGEATPELQKRFFIDHLLDGNRLGRYGLDWSGTMTNTFPAGIQYFKPMGPGQLVISGKYYRYEPDYAFNEVTDLPTITAVKLNNYKETNLDGDLGYEIKALTGKLLITPKAGIRSHHKHFDYDETTIGDNIFYKTLTGPFDGFARAMYLGSDLQLYITDNFSLIGEFVMNSPILGDLGGNMTFEHTLMGVIGTTPAYYYSNAQANYDIDLERYMLGFQFDPTKTVHLKMGVRQEKTTASYKGYFNLPYAITGSQFHVDTWELVINNLFVYPSKQTTTKGMLFFGISADLNM